MIYLSNFKDDPAGPGQDPVERPKPPPTGNDGGK
jgi:hypothetical protein